VREILPSVRCQGANLEAVDRAVRIVRELGRFRGFVARRGGPEALEREALTEGTGTYDGALVCQARYKP
jgi:hypothetical protein